MLPIADYPSNMGETAAMDTLVGLHGKYRDTTKPFHQQIQVGNVYSSFVSIFS